jgi:hypothetical protein
MITSELSAKTIAPAPRKVRRSIVEVLAPLEEITRQSPNLVANHDAQFELAGERYVLPRYLFVGPRGGDTPIRLGIFAGIHGDEPEGVHALVRFIKLLEAKPEVAAGYYLSIYPISNPTGFEDGTRFSRRGKDLNREFWRNSVEPEVRILEAELQARSFQGIISLHTDDTSHGFYGYARGATLTKSLIEPALLAAEQFLPRDERPIIDGFPARNGVIRHRYEGMMTAPPKARPRPFEIILETPATPPAYLKELAFVASLQTILVEYNKFIAYAPNL